MMLPRSHPAWHVWREYGRQNVPGFWEEVYGLHVTLELEGSTLTTP